MWIKGVLLSCICVLVFGWGARAQQAGQIAANPSGADPAPVVIMERSMCFGACPVYRVAIYPDGTVRYEGRKFVHVQGKRQGHMSEQSLRMLLDLFDREQFYSFHNEYTDSRITDMPSVTLTFNGRNGQKRVHHYLGDPSAPEGLLRLEKAVDRLSGIDRWISDPDNGQTPSGHSEEAL